MQSSTRDISQVHRPYDMGAAPTGVPIESLGKQLWRWRWRILLPTLIALVIAALILLMTTSRYTAELRILIDENRAQIIRTPTSPETRVLLDQEALLSHVQMLKSRDLLRKVANKIGPARIEQYGVTVRNTGLIGTLKSLFGLGSGGAPSPLERAIDTLSADIEVYQVNTSRVIAVEYEATDPQFAADLANQLGDSYLVFLQEAYLGATADAAGWLGQEITSLRRQVENAEADVQAYRKLHGIVTGPDDATLTDRELTDLNTELAKLRADRAAAEAKASILHQMLRSGNDLSAASEVLSSSFIQQLQEKRVELAREIAEASTALLPAHPRMRQLQAEMADLRGQIRRETAKIAAGLDNDVRVARGRETSLRSTIETVKTQLQNENEGAIELRALEREAKAQREVLETFLTRHGEASARDSPEATPPEARIVSRAGVPSEPSFPKKLPILALTGFGVFILLLIGHGCYYLFLASAGREPDYAWSASTMQPGQSGSMAAIVPATSNGLYSAATAATGPHPHPVAQVDNYPAAPIAAELHRTERATPVPPAHGYMAQPLPLHQPSPLHQPPIMPEELTLIANALNARRGTEPSLRIALCPLAGTGHNEWGGVNLARALALSGARVILIDANVHAPTVARQLSIPPKPGLADLMAGTHDFGDVLKVDGNSRVHVMATGSTAKHAYINDELRMEHVLHALEGGYGFIVVMTPPPLLSGAARAICARADTAVTIADGEVTDSAMTANVRAILRDAGLAEADIIAANATLNAPMPALARAVTRAA